MNQPQQPENPGAAELGKKFGEVIKNALEQNKNKQASKPPQTVQQEQDQFNLSKPDDQQLGSEIIKWTWNNPFVTVYSYYAREDSGTWGKSAGEYWVGWDWSQDDAVDYGLNSEQTKTFAELLLSAYKWASAWQQFMGEYFMAQPTPEPSITPLPPAPPAQLHVIDAEVEAPKPVKKAVKKAAPKKAPPKETTDGSE